MVFFLEFGRDGEPAMPRTLPPAACQRDYWQQIRWEHADGTREAGGNWVEADRFFDRDTEIESLMERMRDGTHTLMTAQRRMGKTSLVRELLSRLKEKGYFETIFVDIESTSNPADAIAEIGFQSKSAQGTWGRIRSVFGNFIAAGSRDRMKQMWELTGEDG